MSSHKIVAVVGGTASGKTTLASDLSRIGGVDKVEVIPLDAYYRCNAHLSPDERAKVNYDHPAAFEIKLLTQHLESLRSGQAIDMPTYDFATHSRSAKTKRVHPRHLTIVEGILTLHFPEMRELFSYSIFVDTPDELRFSRRMTRDVRERGRTKESVVAQWNETVHPMHEEFCAPTQSFASEIMSGVSWNDDDVRALWSRLNN